MLINIYCLNFCYSLSLIQNKSGNYGRNLKTALCFILSVIQQNFSHTFVSKLYNRISGSVVFLKIIIRDIRRLSSLSLFKKRFYTPLTQSRQYFTSILVWISQMVSSPQMFNINFVIISISRARVRILLLISVN